MNIGIIGAGNIGGSLGKLWTQAGHKVYFSSRNPEKLREVAEEAGPHAQYGSVAEAARFGEVILFALPFWATDDALKAAGSLAGKIVIDATNPYRKDATGWALPDTTTAAQELARKLPGAKLVKAFNTLPADTLTKDAHRPDAERIAVYYSGDDPQANTVVSQLILDSGFVGVEVGTLATVALQEPRGPLYTKILTEPEAARLLDSARQK